MIRPSQKIYSKVGKPVGPDLAEDLKRKADRISFLIVASDYQDVDIDIEINNLSKWCEKHLPESGDLFEIIYKSRFKRLREQFRP